MAQTRKYAITLKGESPLLLHADNIGWQERTKKWQNDPAVKTANLSTPGDDRTPGWAWIGCLTIERNRLTVSADNLMTLLREGGAKCPTGKGQKTFKQQTQSGIIIDQSSWDILINGNPIDAEPIRALQDEIDFERHERVVEDLGFSLFVKRARISLTSKHVRVRPRFDQWELRGTATVFDEQITTQVFQDILTFAGKYSGLGDWRPSAPKSPGSFGRFAATLKEL